MASHSQSKLERYASEFKPSAFEDNFNDLLLLAAEMNASDLHFDPLESGIRVRARIDGTLRVLQWITGASYVNRLFQQIKRDCGFDMGKVAVPQDRRLRSQALGYDLRANLIPTLYGEKIVLRLLQRGKAFSLTKYSMPLEAKADLRRALDLSQGLILITGPTGSGKTTLLYSALSEIDATENNVHTLEDPIEYELPGIIQSDVSPVDMTFASALRALMRQDPDVIMIGEIRDEETAKAAVHAAATGHLVMSTIHSNSALDSLRRLEDLGIARDQVLGNLLFASAQRLIPKNCPHCAEPDESAATIAFERFGEPILPLVSKGCELCGKLGVEGRVLLFEYLTFRPGQVSGERETVTHGTLNDHVKTYLKEGAINVREACAFE